MGTSAVNDFDLNLSHLKEVDSSTFFNVLKVAKTKNEYEAFVTLHPIEDYSHCKGRFLLYDETAGVAVEQDGNIISVFSDKTHRGVLRFLLTKAVESGGIKLDCFGSIGLRTLYHRRGFIPVARTRFIKEFAPDNWNYERDKEPDILFWIFDFNRQSPMEDVIIERDWDNIPEFSSYDLAKAYRDSLIIEGAK